MAEEGVPVTDPKQRAELLIKHREHVIREQWVKAMEARLVRDELEKCHKGEGVNHYENCKWLTELYIEKMKDGQVKGWKKLGPQKPIYVKVDDS